MVFRITFMQISRQTTYFNPIFAGLILDERGDVGPTLNQLMLQHLVSVDPL